MNRFVSQDFFIELLQEEGLEYALFDGDRRLLEFSEGLPKYLLSPPQGKFLNPYLAGLFGQDTAGAKG